MHSYAPATSVRNRKFKSDIDEIAFGQGKMTRRNNPAVVQEATYLQFLGDAPIRGYAPSPVVWVIRGI
jgi:hypothetical protein